MKRVLEENINTKEYWNELLSDEIWGRGRGEIYNKLIPYFPTDEEVTALDIGCAIGHGLKDLARNLPNVIFEGCDFSTTGIRKAKELYGEELNFFVYDVYEDELSKNYDYILLVETLEHVNNPKRVVKKHLKYCDKKMLVTVPYEEGLWKEHVYQFNKDSFNDIREFEECHILKKRDEEGEIILYVFEK